MKAVLLALVLAGCACAPEQVIVTKPVEVRVPVPVPCKTAEIAEPQWATDAVSKDASSFDKARAAVAELAQRMAYEIELKGALDGCRPH